jgi:hypothetical protein
MSEQAHEEEPRRTGKQEGGRGQWPQRGQVPETELDKAGMLESCFQIQFVCVCVCVCV